MVKAIIVVIRHSAIETSVTQIQQKDVTRKSHKNLLTSVYNGDIIKIRKCITLEDAVQL